MKKKKEPSYQTKIIDDFLRTMWNDNFVYAMEYFREKFKIPEFGFIDESTAHKSFPKKSAQELYFSLTPLLKILELPEHFRETLFNVIVFNGRQKLPTKNFKISVYPEITSGEETDEILRHPREVILTTFRALDTEEQKVALKELGVAWKKYFPSYLTKRTNLRKKDIATKYLIKAEMEKRKNPSKEEGFYLRELARSYGKDHFFYKREEKKPGAFEKVGGYTTKDVAEKIHGNKKKVGAIRTEHSRLKKKMKE